jgi:hypothetical protein
MFTGIRNFVFGMLLCFGVGLMLLSCTSADKKACIENDDLQACNRECVRDDKEACAKAELLKAKQQQQQQKK